MSRSTAGQLLYGPGDRLSLVYWDDDVATSNGTPRHVWLRQWSDAAGWTERQQVDHPSGTTLGGRHPSMVLDPGGEIITAWHDYRNCKIGNWADNIEIYGNRWIPGSGFSAANLRLTTSSSETVAGDNGYVPKLARLLDGRLALAWYDFHWDTNRSEICFALSRPDGTFAPASMDDLRLTSDAVRATGDLNYSLIVPSMAVDTSGTLHMVWGTMFQTTGYASKIYYGRFDPVSGTWLEKTRIGDNGGGYLDPAKILADPVRGGVWLVYTYHGSAGNDDIYLQRRPAGTAAFEAPLALYRNVRKEQYPDAAIDGTGRIHLVYVDKNLPGSRVRWAQFDPNSNTIEYEGDLGPTITGSPVYPAWARPAITLDPAGSVYCVWEQETGDDSGELWFTTNRLRNAARDWTVYR